MNSWLILQWGACTFPAFLGSHCKIYGFSSLCTGRKLQFEIHSKILLLKFKLQVENECDYVHTKQAHRMQQKRNSENKKARGRCWGIHWLTFASGPLGGSREDTNLTTFLRRRPPLELERRRKTRVTTDSQK